MPIEELMARLKSIYVWSPQNSVVRAKIRELIFALGGKIE